MGKPDSYSVSRLKTYGDCSQYYYNKYIAKDIVDGGSQSTITGSLVHTALELYYSSEGVRPSLLSCFIDSYQDTLLKLRVLKEGEGSIIGTLLEEYAKDVSILYDRASASYKGKDAIRTKSGEVPSNPSMTTTWKSMSSDMGLDSRRSFIDDYVTSSNPSADFSTTDMFSDAYNLCRLYTYPAELEDVVAIELAISSWSEEKQELLNPVLMPAGFGREEGIYLNAYIDIVSKTGMGTLLCDHKTSREAFSAIDVEHNVQLMTYVYAYRELYGTKPDYIGINNIRAGRLSYIPTPSDSFIDEILSTLLKNHHLIKAGIYSKHSPEPYSKCNSMYGKACPYLAKCWPTMV